VEPFGCAIAIFLEVKGVVSGLSVVYLLVASQSLTPAIFITGIGESEIGESEIGE